MKPAPRTELVAPLSAFAPTDGTLEILDVVGRDKHDPLSRRLCELGLCVGKRVSIVKRGDPAIVRLGESRFALGLDLLQRLLVRPTA